MEDANNTNDFPFIKNYSFSDLKPIDFKNEKDLLNSLEQIMQDTNDSTIDWQKRDASLKRLGSILIGNHNHSQTLIKFYNQKLFINLSTQMSDLRSSLMKEACRIVALSASQLGTLIESGAEKMLTKYILFKLSGSANKLIAEESSFCIFHLIRFIPSQKILIRICEQVQSKGVQIRLRCAQAQILVICEYPTNIITKNYQLIEDSIRTLMKDSNSEVRSTARKAFVKYKERFEQQAWNLFNLLEKNIQKQLKEENKKMFDEWNIDSNNTQNLILRSPTMKKKGMNTLNVSSGDSENSIAQNNTTVPNSKMVNSTKLKSRKSLNESIGSIQSTKPKHKKTNSISSDHKEVNNSFQGKKVYTNRLYKHKNNIEPKKLRFLKEEAKKEGRMTMNSRNSKDSKYLKEMELSEETPSMKVITQEKMNTQIKSNINKFKETQDIQEKIIALEFFYNNIDNIKNELSSIEQDTLKSLIDIHLDSFIETNEQIIMQIMKNLNIFFFHFNQLFSDSNINSIIKYIFIYLSKKESEMGKIFLQLLDTILKKKDNSIVFMGIIELINYKLCNEDLAFEYLIKIFDNCNDLLKSEEDFFNNIFSVLSNSTPNNPHLGLFIDKLYKKYKEQFILSFNKLEESLKQKILSVLEECNSLFLKELNIKEIKEIKEIKDEKEDNEDKDDEIIEWSDNNSEEEETEKEEEKAEKDKEELNIISKIDNTSKETKIPDELLTLIIKNNIELFNKYIEKNPSKIPLFLLEFNNKGDFNDYINFYLICIHSLISCGKFQSELNSQLTVLLTKLVNIATENPFDLEILGNIREIFKLIPFKLNVQNFFKFLSQYLNPTNNNIFLQLILLSFKDFIINNREHDLTFLLPLFVNRIFSLLTHQSNEVRKQSIYCSIEIYLSIGAKFDSYLNQLSSSTQNLIRFYIKKRTGR